MLDLNFSVVDLGAHTYRLDAGDGLHRASSTVDSIFHFVRFGLAYKF